VAQQMEQLYALDDGSNRPQPAAHVNARRVYTGLCQLNNKKKKTLPLKRI
jgi:hypothetical protein